MALVRFYPVGNFNNIASEFDRAIHRFCGGDVNFENATDSETHWHPQVDIRETKDEFLLTMELPGVSKDDLRIHFEDNLLKIEGERKKEDSDENSSYLREERCYGKFSRVFKVNSRVQGDKIDAAYSNGLLTLSLPKAEEAKPKEIKIKASK